MDFLKSLFRFLKLITCVVWLPVVFIFILIALLCGEGGDLPDMPDLSFSADDADLTDSTEATHTPKHLQATPRIRHYAGIASDIGSSTIDALGSLESSSSSQQPQSTTQGPTQKKRKNKITRAKFKAALKASAKASAQKIRS